MRTCLDDLRLFLLEGRLLSRGRWGESLHMPDWNELDWQVLPIFRKLGVMCFSSFPPFRSYSFEFLEGIVCIRVTDIWGDRRPALSIRSKCNWQIETRAGLWNYVSVTVAKSSEYFVYFIGEGLVNWESTSFLQVQCSVCDNQRFWTCCLRLEY